MTVFLNPFKNVEFWNNKWETFQIWILIIIVFLAIYYFLYDPVYPNDGLIKNWII